MIANVVRLERSKEVQNSVWAGYLGGGVSVSLRKMAPADLHFDQQTHSVGVAPVGELQGC